MRPDKFSMAKSWINDERSTPEEAKATWEAMGKEFDENRKAMLMACAESDSFKAMMNEKFGSGTMKYGSEISQPPARPDVIEIDAINAFIRRNPQADGGRIGFDNGGGADKYVTPLRRKYPGKKYYYVKDPTYSEGRRAVKYPAYEKWLKEQHALPKPKDIYKRTVRPELDNYLTEIAEAMQKADNTQDFEHLMRNKKASTKLEEQQAQARKKAGKKVYKQKVYPKGMLSLEAIKILENLETDPVNLKIIADSLGEDTDWVLEILDERNQYVEDVKRERSLAKENPLYKKPRNDYLKVENWLQKNASKYATPEAFEKALIKRFGNQNQFVIDMKKGGSIPTTYFSDDFKKTMLNADPRTPIKSSHLKQLIKSSLYNFNPKIKKALTEEIKNIFNSGNLPKLRTEARALLNNNKLLSRFGLNKAITGPFAKVIQAEIGQQMWNDITNFRQHRVGTQEMLKAFEQLVAPEFKPIFNEAAKAIQYSKQNQWAKAKEVFGIADNIAWDHKIPSSIIDKGYADIIEYTKVQPTTSNFNSRIKNAQFDRPINQLLNKFENAKTLDAKQKIYSKMLDTKNKFSEKFSGYLDEVNIDLDKKGNLKFSSSAKPLTMGDERVAMLGKSLVQEGKFTDKEIKDIIKSVGCPNFKSGGGRIEFSEGADCFDKGQKLINNGMQNATPASKKNFSKIANNLFKMGAAVTKYGILPEAVIIAADTSIRMGLGDTFEEGLLRATDYITPDSIFGDFAQKADLLKVERMFSPEIKEIVAQSLGYKNQLDKIQSLKDQKQNLELLSGDGGAFDEIGDLSLNIKQVDDRLKKAQFDLKDKFTTTGQESKNLYAQSILDESYDKSKADSPISKLRFKDQMEGMSGFGLGDYTETESSRVYPRQKTQAELNKDLSERSPLTGTKGEQDFLSLSQLPMGPMIGSEIDLLADAVNKNFAAQGSDKRIDSQYLKAMQDFKNNYKNMSMEDMLAIGIPAEAVYGFNMAEPVDMTNYKPSDRYKDFKLGMFSEGGITGLRSKYEYKK